jgi:trimeric autotransporter adhesin
MKQIHSFRFLAVMVAGLLLAACANLQEPAQKLIAEIDAAVAAAGADAQQYVPEQVADVKQKLADLKTAYDNKDYKSVMAGAPAVVTAAKALADAAAAKKTEVLAALNTQWTSLATSLPAATAAIEAKLATIAKSHSLPKGVSKDAVATAKTGLADAKAAWADATSTFGSGNVQGALDKASGVKAKLDEIAAKLGIAAPAATPST